MGERPKGRDVPLFGVDRDGIYSPNLSVRTFPRHGGHDGDEEKGIFDFCLEKASEVRPSLLLPPPAWAICVVVHGSSFVRQRWLWRYL